MTDLSPPSARFGPRLDEHQAAATMVAALRSYLEANGSASAGVLERRSEELLGAIELLGSQVGLPFSVLFAPSACLIEGLFLRGPRWVHEAADEARARLQDGGIAELVVRGVPGAEELAMLAEACRAQGARAERCEGLLQWRAVQSIALVRGIDLESLDPEQHFETVCAWAITSLRGLASDLRHAPAGAELRARQIARALITLPATAGAALLYTDRVRQRLSAPAERAIGRTLLAVAMMRTLSKDPAMLLEVAVAAMLLDLVGWPEGQDGAERHPAVAARTLQAMARTDAGSVMRAVVAYEALWLLQAGRLGQLYGGQRVAGVHARVLYAAWCCFSSPDKPLRAAIERLHAAAASDREHAVVRLLCHITRTSVPSPSAVKSRHLKAPSPGSAGSGESPQPSAHPFSDQDMAAILAELGAPDSFPPTPPSTRPGGSRSSRPARPDARDERSSHAPVRPSDAPRNASVVPSVIPGNLLDDSERVAAAEQAFDAAEACWAMGDMEEALGHADTAVMLLPHRPSYVAMQAYLEAIQGGPDAAVYEGLIDRVDRALAGAEADARAHYYRGLLLRCAGKSFASKQAFRKGLELAPDDPDLQDALDDSGA